MRGMRHLPLRLAAPIGLAMLLSLSPAVGQEPGSGLRGHNTNAPVDVASDRIEVQDRADRAIFSGNVDVRQGALRLNSERLTVAYANTGGLDIKRLEASGGVRLTSPTERAQAQFAIYDLDRRIITMVGGVTLNQGANVIRGGRLTLELESGRAVMDGGGPPGTDTTGGRVTGRFTVPQRAG